MQNYRESDSAAEAVLFAKKIEDIQGGVTLLSSNHAVDDIIPGGSLIGKHTGGLFRVIKTAILHANAGNTATDYQVKKAIAHNFKVGDFLASATGAKAYPITVIDKSNADYDVLTVSTTLGVALTAGATLFQALAEAASNTSTYIVTPYALTGHSVKIKAGDNHSVDALIRCSVFEANVPPVTTAIKALLPNILWL